MNLGPRIEKNRIIKLFGRPLYNRSVKYLENAFIRKKRNISDPAFLFIVSGTDGKHEVRIEFYNDKNDTFAHHCSCFTDSYCEHIGAVLIKHFELPENPLVLENFSNEKPDTIIPINQGENKDNLLFMNFKHEFDEDIEENVKTDSNRYCLVFRIFGNEYQDRWSIRPGIGLINKENTVRRVYSFSRSKITEPLSINEKNLLNCLLSKYRHTDKFSNYLSFIKDNPEIKIFSLVNRKQCPLKFYTVSSAVVRFEFAGIKSRKIPYFNPVIDLYDENRKFVYIFKKPDHVFLRGMMFYIIDMEKGMVLCNEYDSNFSGFLLKILKYKKVYQPDDIKELENLLKEEAVAGISIDFTQKQLRIIYTIPGPVLEINEYSESITVNLLFNYSGREFSFEREEKLLRVRNSTEEYLAAQRNMDFEQSRYYYLKELFKNYITSSFEDSTYYRPLDYTFRLSCPLKDFIVSFAGILLDKKFEIRKSGELHNIKSRAKILFTVSRNMDWLDVTAKAVDPENNNFRIMFESGFLDNLFVKSDKGYHLISKEDVERLRWISARGMSADGRIRISQHDYNTIDKMYESISEKEPELKKKKGFLSKLKNFTEIEKVKIPAGFKTSLRKYQKAGLNWLYFLYRYDINGCLADDMGLGKTVQTLALLHKLKAEGRLRNVLVAAPVSTIANWKDEISRFTQGFKVVSYHGNSRNKYRSLLKKADIIITSYSTLRNDIDDFLNLKFSYFILDESQTIKNPLSKIFRCVKLIKSEHRLCLSGTPIENNTVELWSQMNFLMPGLLGKLKDFKREFTRPIEESNDSLKTEILRKTVFPFILKRRKEEVAGDLPEKEEIIQYVEMEAGQKEVYEEIREYYKKRVQDALEEKRVQNAAIDILSALLKLRQAAIFPFMADKDFRSIPSCKFETLKELVTDIVTEGHKILVFSQFVKSLKKIESYFKRKKYNYVYLDGSTTNRKKIISAFQNDDSISLFLISLKAGGLGINLTAADYVILFDPWWNPALEKQAVDRSHRIGQTKKVISYKLIVKDTVEEKILTLQEKKKILVENIVSGETTFFKSLTKRDVMSLFS